MAERSYIRKSAATFLDNKEFFENSSYVSLSRVRRLKDLVFLDDTILKIRFESSPFFRGLRDQVKEYKRFNILHVPLPTFIDSQNVFSNTVCEVVWICVDGKKRLNLKTKEYYTELKDMGFLFKFASLYLPGNKTKVRLLN